MSKKGQRRLPGCHLRLGKNWWWRGTRSFGRGCCLPSCRGKKQTVVIYICLPHFSETFAFFSKINCFNCLDFGSSWHFCPSKQFPNTFKHIQVVLRSISIRVFLVEGNFDFTTLCSPKMTTTMLKSNCRREYESFSDVGEIRVWFASKILTPCRMH